MYAHRAYVNKGFQQGLSSLRLITPLVLHSLTVESLFEVTVEFFTDVLVNFPAFFEADHLASLATILSDASAQEWVLALRAGDFGEDAQDYSRLLFAYGDAAVQNLAKNTDDRSQAQVLQQLVELVDCEGYDVAEIQISSQAVEFWQTFTEHVIDELFTDDGTESWIETAKQYVVSALERGWARIRFPSQDVVASWDSETRTDFKALRRDLQDLVQASWMLLGLSIFENFARLTLNALDRQAWSDAEAALYCLNALSDSAAINIAADDVLSKIFGSHLFAGSMSTTADLPIQTRQTALDTITNYTAFFERQHKHLPDMLTYLFNCLNSPALANAAAKAIFSTCSSCSKRLVGEIRSFLSAYQTLQQSDTNVKEKVIGAIAVVIREISQRERYIGPLSELLGYVEKDATVSTAAIAAGHVEEALASGLCALRCLVSMGKALQSSDEITIDLEADPETEECQLSVWALSAGLELQSRIVRLLQAITSSLNFDSDVIEAACLVLRTGYKGTHPGLFVLPPRVTVGLVEFGFRSGFGSPKLNYLLDTASAMLSRRHYAATKAMSDASSKLLRLVLVFVRSRNSKRPKWTLIGCILLTIFTDEPSGDPEIAASCIDLVGKMIPHYFESLFEHQNLDALPGLFVFSLRCLAIPEIMPKRAAASFWVSEILQSAQPRVSFLTSTVDFSSSEIRAAH